MANYSSLKAAIDAGTTNMTAVRNNSANDDSIDTIATGITWFYFNSVQVTNLYASGNSFIGLGSSSEQLKVNRRDCKVYYEWTESGVIGINKFFKFRWTGYSAFSQTLDSYAQGYDVFLIDNGQIFLNFFDVPTSSLDGTNSLTCNSETMSYSVTAGVACEYTFTPTDAATGTGWSVSSGKPSIFLNYKTSGSAVYEISGISGVIKTSYLSFESTATANTSLVVSTSLDGVNYSAIGSGWRLMPPGSYTNQKVYVKIEMNTTVVTETPTISNICFIVQTEEDTYCLILEMEPLQRFESSAGDITVSYDGAGNLAGSGGAVQAFSQVFTPTGLVSKPNQNDVEHIEISSISAVSNLMRIYYTDSKGDEHVEISSITATATLKNINDI